MLFQRLTKCLFKTPSSYLHLTLQNYQSCSLTGSAVDRDTGYWQHIGTDLEYGALSQQSLR